MALSKYCYNIYTKPHPTFPAILLSNVFNDMWKHWTLPWCMLYLHNGLPLPKTSPGNVSWSVFPCRQPIMKFHHSYATPRAPKGKNCGSLFFFCPVTVVTGEQADGNLLLADTRSSFPLLTPPPLPPRELELHPLASTSKEINRHIVIIFFLIYLQDTEKNTGYTYSLKSKTLYA